LKIPPHSTGAVTGHSLVSSGHSRAEWAGNV